MLPIAIHGIGSALPERVVSNAELEAMTGFPAARVEEMFEIRQRHWSRAVAKADPDEGQRCSDLAVLAARDAMRAAGTSPSDIGAIIAVTTTPEAMNPPLDFLLAQRLGTLGVPAFTLHAPCTGMFRAAELAAALHASLGGRLVLLVASETPSPFFRFGPEIATDQMLNSWLYADGAGALVLGAIAGERRPTIQKLNLLINSDAAAPGITFPGMLSAFPPSAERYAAADYLGHHDYRRVLRRGSKLAAGAALRMVEELGATIGDVKAFVTHQATGNIRRIAAAYGMPPEKIPVNIDRVGNTIGASVLILLDELAKQRAFAEGDLLILHTAESSTWSSAAMAVRW